MIVRSGTMNRALRCAALALMVGCAHAGAAQRPYPEPSAEALLGALAAHQKAVTSMNARVRATSWLGGERVRATINMLVVRDGHLRFEAEVSLEGTVATLATDGEHFALLDARKNELERGPACPTNVASLVRIPLAPADVAAVLLGDAPLPPSAAGTVSWDAARGADRLVVPSPEGGVMMFFFRGADTARTLVAAERVGVDGKRLWQTSYEDVSGAGEARLPGTIRFAERNGSFDDGVEIKFKDRTLNVSPPPGAFTLAAPPGVAVKDIGCGTPP
jgi:outer membrane lipoprotein-sorting protein